MKGRFRFLLAAAILFAAPPSTAAPPAAPAGGYEPKVGDAAISWVYSVKPGKEAEAKAFLKAFLPPRLQTDPIVGDDYMTFEDGRSEIVHFRFCDRKYAGMAPHRAGVEEGVGPFLSGRMTQHDYRIVSVVNGSFVPREGDRVTVSWLQVRTGRLAEAEAIYRERIEPAPRADASLRAAYLLEEHAAAAWTALRRSRGEAGSLPKKPERYGSRDVAIWFQAPGSGRRVVRERRPTRTPRSSPSPTWPGRA